MARRTITDREELRRYGWDLEPAPKSVTAGEGLWEFWLTYAPQSVLLQKSSSRQKD